MDNETLHEIRMAQQRIETQLAEVLAFIDSFSKSASKLATNPMLKMMPGGSGLGESLASLGK